MQLSKEAMSTRRAWLLTGLLASIVPVQSLGASSAVLPGPGQFGATGALRDLETGELECEKEEEIVQTPRALPFQRSALEKLRLAQAASNDGLGEVSAEILLVLFDLLEASPAGLDIHLRRAVEAALEAGEPVVAGAGQLLRAIEGLRQGRLSAAESDLLSAKALFKEARRQGELADPGVFGSIQILIDSVCEVFGIEPPTSKEYAVLAQSLLRATQVGLATVDSQRRSQTQAEQKLGDPSAGQPPSEKQRTERQTTAFATGRPTPAVADLSCWRERVLRRTANRMERRGTELTMEFLTSPPDGLPAKERLRILDEGEVILASIADPCQRSQLSLNLAGLSLELGFRERAARLSALGAGEGVVACSAGEFVTDLNELTYMVSSLPAGSPGPSGNVFEEIAAQRPEASRELWAKMRGVFPDFAAIELASGKSREEFAAELSKQMASSIIFSEVYSRRQWLALFLLTYDLQKAGNRSEVQSACSTYLVAHEREGFNADAALPLPWSLVKSLAGENWKRSAEELVALLRQPKRGRSAYEPQLLARLLGMVSITDEARRVAISRAQEVIAEIEARLRDTRTDEFSIGLSSDAVANYDSVIKLLVQEADSPTAFLNSEKARSHALRQLLGNRSLRPSQTEDNAVERELSDLRSRIADAERASHADGDAGASQPSVEELRLELDRLLIRSKLTDARYYQRVPVEARGLREVQAKLPGDTWVLSFYSLPEELLVWAIDAEESHLIRVPLSRDELQRKVSRFRQEVESRSAPTSRGTNLLSEHDGSVSAGYDLSSVLLEPLVPYLDRPSLILVPHGSLHFLPFAALRDPRTGRYLIEEHSLWTVPSASALDFLGGRELKAHGAIVVMGDPATADRTLGPLPGARREASAVAARLRVTALLGEDATEARLREQARGASVLHLAAHAVLVPSEPRSAYLALAADQVHDGKLEVREILDELRLDGAPLVVLSACDTGLGGHTQGDEVVGLVRAFLAAGSSAVLATLWSIDDSSPTKLMAHFYGSLLQGKAAEEALRLAQLELLQDPQYAAPYYWAAFSLTGTVGKPR